MRILLTKKMSFYDENGFWADFNWRDDTKTWYCRGGNSSEGFWNRNPDISSEITDDEMTWLILKYQ
jgi:hypothetical protein